MSTIQDDIRHLYDKCHGAGHERIPAPLTENKPESEVHYQNCTKSPLCFRRSGHDGECELPITGPKKGKKARRREASEPHKTSSQAEPSPVKVALHEILRDGEFHPSVSIYQAVKEKLGSVKPITVFGALRNGQEFERVGKDYRMVM